MPEHNQRMFSRQNKESHVNTIEYEVRMLRFTLDWLSRSGSKHQPEEEMWAMLESFLLHYRNLVNFLSGSGRTRSSFSIAEPNRWAEKRYDKTETDAIRKLADAGYKAYSNDISIYLAHCTPERYERGKDWQPQKMYNELLPALEKFQQLISDKTATLPRAVLLDDAAYSTTSTSKIQTFTSPENIVFVPGKKRN